MVDTLQKQIEMALAFKLEAERPIWLEIISVTKDVIVKLKRSAPHYMLPSEINLAIEIKENLLYVGEDHEQLSYVRARISDLRDEAYITWNHTVLLTPRHHWSGWAFHLIDLVDCIISPKQRQDLTVLLEYAQLIERKTGRFW